MSAEQQHFLQSDDTQEFDVRALWSLEDQEELLQDARICQLIAWGYHQQIRDLSDRGEDVPIQLYRLSHSAAMAAEEYLGKRSRVAQVEYHRTHPSPLKRMARWLGALTHSQR